jgi:hypothetical protein
MGKNRGPSPITQHGVAGQLVFSNVFIEIEYPNKKAPAKP